LTASVVDIPMRHQTAIGGIDSSAAGLLSTGAAETAANEDLLQGS